jgi:glycosyltransferase involved in cell wall biosynthesis
VPLGRALARRLAASGAELVFVSEALRSRFARLAGRTVGAVEAMAVPRALFARRARPDAALRAALGVAAPMVLAVGRLVPIKGHDVLVRASAIAGARAGRPLELVVLGDGPERERLRALAARLGVALRLPGRVPRRDVAAHLRAADVFVQPSRVTAGGRSEGLPVAALEALAVGLPVIASDSGGLAELAGQAGGAVDLFVPDDATALAAAIGRRLSAACIENVSAA